MHSLQPSYGKVGKSSKFLILQSPTTEQRVQSTLAGDDAATAGLEAGQVLVQDTVTKLCRAYVAGETLAGDDVLHGILSHPVPVTDFYTVGKDEVTKTAKDVTITAWTGGELVKSAIVSYHSDIDSVFNGKTVAGSSETGDHYKFNI